ncbi:DnaD domain protein [Apilactobacillus micheneri]|uniref:DnaD domain protein n=1 Tax=Apilactobacillus micheneri TaxID=1899430 RepID=UPI000D029ADD|nr:DnaD domain protein [Apilactobacillus micheneri]
MTKVYKDRQSNFTHVKNDIFDSDKYADVNTLSWKAMGIFTYMWHKPDDWEFYEDELASHVSDGKASLRSGLKELEKAGFIKRIWNRTENGKFASYDWMLNEAPFCDFPKTGNPKSDKPKTDNRKLLSTDGTKYLNNQILNDDEEEALQNYKYAFETPDKPISNFMLKKIIKLIKSVNPDVFEYAIDLAATGNAKSPYNFINKLLDDWNKHKLSTLEQVKNYSDSFKKAKAKKGTRGRKPKKEHLPEWATQTPEERKSENKRKQEEHDYKMQHDPEYRKHQEKTDKDLEDNLRRIRELRKEKNYE